MTGPARSIHPRPNTTNGRNGSSFCYTSAGSRIARPARNGAATNAAPSWPTTTDPPPCMHKPHTRQPSYSQTSSQRRFNVTSSAAAHAERSGTNTSKPSMPGAPDMNAWLPRPRPLPKSSSTQVDWSSDGWRTATQHRRPSMLNERRRADADVIAERGEEGQEC